MSIAPPRISVIMANYRGAEWLLAALGSVLGQTLAPFEVIVSDDASPDDSLALIRRMAAGDPRIRLIEAAQNGGPGAARNRALDAARGDWLAIVDSDDILHPERFARLIDAAEASGADAVCDDLLYFPDPGGRSGLTLLDGSRPPMPLTPEYFIKSASVGSGLTSLGYLKPMVRRAALADLRYDPAVRIGEDYDLLLRFLLAGGKVQVLPVPYYLYRRHAGSISHRLSEARVAEMIANQDALAERGFALSPAVQAGLTARRTGLTRDLRFEQLVAALKGRRPLHAAGLMLRDPGLLPMLSRALREHWQNRRPLPVIPPAARADLVLAGPDTPRDPTLERALGLQNSQWQNVPAWPQPNSPDDGAALWPALARRAGGAVVAHDLAGLYAAGFLPAHQGVTAVIASPDEAARALQLARALAARVVLADAITADFAETSALCVGYKILQSKGKTE